MQDNDITVAQPQGAVSQQQETTKGNIICRKVLGRFLAIAEVHLVDHLPRLRSVLDALIKRDKRNAIIHIKLARYGGEAGSKAFQWIETWVEELVASLPIKKEVISSTA